MIWILLQQYFLAFLSSRSDTKKAKFHVGKQTDHSLHNLVILSIHCFDSAMIILCGSILRCTGLRMDAPIKRNSAYMTKKSHVEMKIYRYYMRTIFMRRIKFSPLLKPSQKSWRIPSFCLPGVWTNCVLSYQHTLSAWLRYNTCQGIIGSKSL